MNPNEDGTETGLLVGTITIDLRLTPDGDEQTTLEVDGELGIAMQLGLLEMAKNTILYEVQHGEDDD